MAKSLIGIDVNLNEMSMVSKGKIFVEQLPDNLVDSEGIVSEISFANFVKEMKKSCGISGSECAFVLPQNATYFRTYDSPVMTDEQVKLNLPFEFKNFVGNDTTKFCYDYYIGGVENDDAGKPVTMKVVAAAANKEISEQFGDNFVRAGLKPKSALPHEVCLINLMKNTADEYSEYCLVGVGYEQTSIYMFSGASLEATKVVEIGTRDIDKKLAETYDIDDHLAASYRESNYDNCLVNEALSDIYDKISLEVMKTINFYKYEHNDSNVDTVYFFDLSASNKRLNDDICEHINFAKGDINDILPAEYQDVENADRCLYAIGLVL